MRYMKKRNNAEKKKYETREWTKKGSERVQWRRKNREKRFSLIIQFFPLHKNLTRCWRWRFSTANSHRSWTLMMGDVMLPFVCVCADSSLFHFTHNASISYNVLLLFVNGCWNAFSGIFGVIIVAFGVRSHIILSTPEKSRHALLHGK